LRSLAAALEDAQAVATAAQREYAAAEEGYARLEDHAWALSSAGVPEDDPRMLGVRVRQQEEARAMTQARARHETALADHAAADRWCARRIRALAEDGLGDPWAYRALSQASTVGHDVGTVGLLTPVAPELGPLALGGDTVGTLGDLGLLAAYGEGSWSGFGLAAGCTTAGFAGRALATGAGAGARLGATGAEVVGRLSSRERVLAGSVAEARRRVAAVRRTFEVPAERATPPALTGGPPLRTPRGPAPGPTALVRAGTASVRARVRAAADARFLDDWRLATVNGTRGMYTSGVTLQVAAAAGQRAVDRGPGTARSDPAGRRDG
jgi:hypothetical protein